MTALAGTGGLVRLVLRRDRFILPVWVLLLGIIPMQYGVAIDGLLPTEAAREEYLRSIVGSPGLLALLGPAFNASLGALAAWRAGFLLVIVGLASLLTVIRHTRTDEEAGRRELLGSTVVGRHAPLAAALLVTVAADLVLGAIAAAGLLALGLPAVGAAAFGLGMAAVGWVFAAIGAVAAQLTEGAGAARGLAAGALGAAFLLRAAGDSVPGGSASWLTWLSPIGWSQQLRAFAGERWWVAALSVGLAAVAGAAAVALSARRDAGAGVVVPRSGPAAAAPGLRSPVALAWRLHRGMLVGWTAGLAVGGVVIGSVVDSTTDMAAESTQIRDILQRIGGAQSLADAFLSTTGGFVALVVAGYAVQATLRLRAEEDGLRAEPVLATATGRVSWAASHLVFGALGPALALAAFGLAAGLTYGAIAGDVGGQLPRALGGAMVQLPAVWVLGGIAAALFGLVPRLAQLTWALLGAFVLIGLLGPLMRLSQSVMDLSPFTHVPRIPGGELAVPPLAWLVAVAAALVAAGLAAFRRRDVG